jgi:hypothetical protein
LREAQLQEIITYKLKMAKYQIFTRGNMKCQPEDVRGFDGYIEMLKVLRNPNNEEYES